MVLALPQYHRQFIPLVLIGAALGLSPDVDYLLLWGVGWQPQPRVTHSIAFVTACSLLAWLLVRVTLREQAGSRLLLAFLCAAASHLAMDALVGVTENPLAWPLSDGGFRSSIGLLPSAGAPDPRNFYFWRNLLIELGIVVPALCLANSIAKRRCIKMPSASFLVSLCVFVAALTVSMGLSR